MVIAVSGGIDSVTLLDVLVEMGLRPTVFHCHHGLRPEADGDAELVEKLANRYTLPFVLKRVATPRQNMEAAARELRYAALAELVPPGGVAMTAHTRDDQAETFLLRAIRGAGLDGLRGIRPRRALGQGTLIRPMLEVSRAEVVEYASRRGLEYRHDASNEDMRIVRNRIRHELLPLLETYNPRVKEALAAAASALEVDGAALDELARAWVEANVQADHRRMRLPLELLLTAPEAIICRVFKQAMGPLRPGRAHLHALLELLEAPCGTQVSLPGRRQAVRQVDAVVVGPELATESIEAVSEGVLPGRLEWQGRVLEGAVVAAQGSRPDGRSRVWLDKALAGTTFRVRSRRPGDRFRHKKLKAWLIDRKVPRDERDALPLLVMGDEQIVWVVGQQVDDRYVSRENVVLEVRSIE